MFDIGWGELVVIGVVALIAIGPKELPSVLRTLGQGMAKIRRMAAEFQGQFQEAMREAEVADLKKSVDDLKNTATGFSNFDPLGDTKKDIEKTFEDKPVNEVAPTAGEPSAAALPQIDVPLPDPLPALTADDFHPPPVPSPVETPAAPPSAEPGAKKAGTST
jgi:sec-independent protein translocase protein TatB